MIEHGIETILDSWDDWDAEASQAAQQEQNADAWRFVMRDHLRSCLSRAVAGSVSGNIVARLRAIADASEGDGLMGFAIVTREAADEIEYLRHRCEEIDHEWRQSIEHNAIMRKVME